MLTAPATPPWLDGGDIKFHPELIGKSSRKDPAKVRKADAEATLARLRPAWLQVFTDGSAVEGLRKGGAGIVLYVTEDKLVVHEDCVGRAVRQLPSGDDRPRRGSAKDSGGP